MFKYFRSNDPYLLPVVFGVLMVIRIVGSSIGFPFLETEWKWLLLGERLAQGFRMYSEAYDYTAPLSAYTFKLLDWMGGRSRVLPQLAATVVIMFQAAVFNGVMLRNRAYGEQNYLPAFFYVLLASTLRDSFALSPQLLSMTFVVMALNNIFRRINNEIRDELFVYAGLYLGTGLLFYLPSILFSVALVGSLILFSSPTPRRILLFFYGLSVPVLLCFCYFYWNDAHWVFIDSFGFRGIFSTQSFDMGWANFFASGSLMFALLAIALFATLTMGRFTNYRTKVQQVMILMALASFGVLLADVELTPHQLIFFVPTTSFFLSHYILLLRRRLFKVMMPLILLPALLTYPYWPLWRNSGNALAANVRPADTDGSLMYLGDNLSAYETKQIASPFLDERLSDYWIEKLDYYQPAAVLFGTLQKSRPDVIVDRRGVVDKLFFRFPLFAEEYRKEGDQYVRVKPTD